MKAGFPLLLAGVVAAGTAGLAAATDGFRVVTSDGARRLAVARIPPLVPSLPLTDASDASFSLADYRGRTVLVEFVYTRCPTLCGVLGEAFGAVQDLARREQSADGTALLSISFDVARDRPPDLAAYGDRFGARAPLWRIAVPSAADLPRLLDGFGVVVIPDGLGGFIHNGAVFVVGPEGRLVRILDPLPPAQLLAEAVAAVRR